MPGHAKYFDPKRVQTTARRSEQSDRLQRLVNWITVAVVLVVLIITVVLFLPVIKRHQGLVERKDAVLAEIQEEKNRSVQLSRELHLLQENPVYIERIARDVLNYGRKGETVFRFPPYEDTQ